MDLLAGIGTWALYVLWGALLLLASLLVYPGLGGNFVILGLAVVHALVTGFDPLGWGLLLVLLGLAVLGEVVESLLGIVYVARKGVTRRGVAGAFVGGLLGAAVGTPLAPVVGTVLGGFLGAFAGAAFGEYLGRRLLAPSLRAGGHAFAGKMLAILVKHALGLAMVALILRATWPAR